MGSKEKVTVARRVHIADQPITMSNWHQHIDWLNVTFIIFVPLIGLASAYMYPAHLYTIIFAVVYYFNAGLGITAGMLAHDSPTRAHVHQHCAQATTASGHTHHTKRPSRLRYTSPLAASVPRKGLFAGGPGVTVRTTDTPTPTRIPTRSRRASGTPTSAGW